MNIQALSSIIIILLLTIPNLLDGQTPSRHGRERNLAGAVDGALLEATPLERAFRAVGKLDVTLKMFESGEADRLGLGFSYEWGKDLQRWGDSPGSPSIKGIILNIHGSGNVAPNRNMNPRDFLRTGAMLSGLISLGGVARELTPVEADTLDVLIAVLMSLEGDDEIDNHPANHRALDLVTATLSPQVVLTLDGKFDYETTQSFSERQLAYGGRFGLDIKPWQPGSTLAMLNFLDWPFAITRWLSGVDNTFSPRGVAFPAMLFGVDRVSPLNDSTRAAVEGLSDFTRFVAETGIRTVAGRWRGGLVHVAGNIRLYQEIGASEAIKAANLDRAIFFIVAATAPNGVYVSYSTGRLPFDRKNDKVYEVGLRYRF